MKARPIIIILCAGIITGTIVGALRQERLEPAAQHAGAASALGGPEITLKGDSSLRLAFPGDDGRLGRVFSALQQPIRLRQRFELAEALRGVSAGD